jgi:cell division topological specificity factor
MRFLNRLFGSSEPQSSQVAKERLQLVLVQDRIKISPAVLEKMKDELITVISRYVEIEPEGVQVTFTQTRHQSRLMADIPVVGPAIGRSSRSPAGKRARGND